MIYNEEVILAKSIKNLIQSMARLLKHPDFKRIWMDKLQTLMQQVDKATFI